MKSRLDAELVRRGLARSRELASELIDAGQVLVGGIPATKAATSVDWQTSIKLKDEHDEFVSRGGHKLAGALEHFSQLNVADLVALDAGASTGGFTDVLLKRGVKQVVAVDVGYGQLAWELQSDSRVKILDRVNVRNLTPQQVGVEIDLVVADLSFISLRVLPVVTKRQPSPIRSRFRPCNRNGASMSKSIKSILLVTHPMRAEAISAANEIAKLLIAKQIKVYSTIDTVGANSFSDSDQVDLAVVLGGDGTMLRAAQICRGKNTPILGINLGHVGFLAEIDRPSVAQIVDSISAGSFTVEERMSLNYQLQRGGKTILDGWALNEVLVERNDHQMIDLFVQIDHRPLSRWWCDSVICATPTGSTAYAYSAGGPVVWPEVDALVLLPLAAHALFSRPMVVSPNSEIVLDLESESADLNADGIRRTKLEKSDRIILTSAKEDVLLAHIKAATFTDRLVAKFKLPVEGWRGE